GQVLQPLKPQTLEIVRAGARFEGAATQHRRPGGLDGVRDLDDLVATLDAARSGHDDDAVAADAHATFGYFDDTIVRAGGAAAQLVRLLDAQRVHDAIHLVKYLAGDARQVAYQCDDSAVVAVDGMGFDAHGFGLANDGANIGC